MPRASLRSMAADIAELWLESYQGEVLGERLFQAVSEVQGDCARRHECEVLALLERATREIAEAVFDRFGMDRGDLDTVVAQADLFAEGARAAAWPDFADAILAATGTYLEKYRGIVSLARDDAERQVGEAYIAHEEALATWARRATGSEDGDPLEEVLALPHVIAAMSPA